MIKSRADGLKFMICLKLVLSGCNFVSNVHLCCYVSSEAWPLGHLSLQFERPIYPLMLVEIAGFGGNNYGSSGAFSRGSCQISRFVNLVSGFLLNISHSLSGCLC